MKTENNSIYGIFIALDGGNGAYKSTCLTALEKHLTAKGHDVVCTAEPGGTPIGQKIRVLARSPENAEMSPLAGMLLFAAARAQNVAEVIRPALQKGSVVLCDRWTPSSRSFQHAGQGLSLDLVTRIDAAARDGMEADFTLIFDLDPRVGLQRTGGRQACDDKFELTGGEFLDRVRAEYLLQAQETPERFKVVDASRSYDQVLQSVIDAVDDYLERR